MDAETARAGPAESARELGAVRSRRLQLRRAMEDVETAIARPLAGRPVEWTAAALPSLADLAEAFARHVDVTEGAGGLFEQVRAEAPRLAGRLQQLAGDHAQIGADVAAVQSALGGAASDSSALEGLREQVTQLLARLIRHRQQGADLLYEAYQVDIGGGE